MFYSYFNTFWFILMIYLILRPCSGIQPPTSTSFLWENIQHITTIHFSKWFQETTVEIKSSVSILDFGVAN